MTVLQHPHDNVLLPYAAGTLPPALHLVISVHLEGCTRCRRLVGQFEAVGGLVLEHTDPVAMAVDARDRALAAISVPLAVKPAPRRAKSVLPPGIEMPEALRDRQIGPWRWVSPGIRISKIEGLWHTRTRSFLLKASPGVAVPDHDHDGLELAQMLAGALVDEGVRYGPGDCAQAMPGRRHQPRADAGEGCICLIAIDGRIRPSHWSARFVQRFVDI